MDTDEMPPELDDAPVDLDREPGYTSDGYRDLVPPEDPYEALGGLARPDAYTGAKQFDCPNCKAPKDEKCVVFLERQNRWGNKHVPCLSRIKLARKAGLL